MPQVIKLQLIMNLDLRNIAVTLLLCLLISHSIFLNSCSCSSVFEIPQATPSRVHFSDFERTLATTQDAMAKTGCRRHWVTANLIYPRDVAYMYILDVY
ncbi:hypothetical protein B0H14DRAFT_2890244, partial [Mycena olivaceomarginata]